MRKLPELPKRPIQKGFFQTPFSTFCFQHYFSNAEASDLFKLIIFFLCFLLQTPSLQDHVHFSKNIHNPPPSLHLPLNAILYCQIHSLQCLPTSTALQSPAKPTFLWPFLCLLPQKSTHSCLWSFKKTQRYWLKNLEIPLIFFKTNLLGPFCTWDCFMG